MNVDNIRLAVGYRGGRVGQNIITKDELSLLLSEIDRFEVALAETEKRWRAERANGRMWKDLYTRHVGHAPVNWCGRCHWWKRLFCLTACPAVQEQHETW